VANENDPSAIDRAVERIIDLRRERPAQRAVLVAISGIDGCGKGYITSRIAGEVEARGFKVAQINIDGWLNLPSRRFNPDNPAEHFYLHAIRFEEMFAQLVLPLREKRSLRLEADLAEETATAYYKHLYEFSDIDVILLEAFIS
jgi:uridine kinase